MLALPLQYYDEAGRILPPKALFWLHIWLLQSILIFMGAAVIKDSSAEILAFWYPSKTKLYLAMLTSIPACLCLLLVSYRNILWERNLLWPFHFVKPCLLLSLGLQTILLVNTIVAQKFHFSYTSGFTILLNMCGALYVFKSYHLKAMCRDWQLRIVK
jgi:hypothetical protein